MLEYKLLRSKLINFIDIGIILVWLHCCCDFVHYQGQERADLFVQDFIITQLISKDILELCAVKNPMGLLVDTLQRLGQPEPEPRYIIIVIWICVHVCV